VQGGPYIVSGIFIRTLRKCLLFYCRMWTLSCLHVVKFGISVTSNCRPWPFLAHGRGRPNPTSKLRRQFSMLIRNKSSRIVIKTCLEKPAVKFWFSDGVFHVPYSDTLRGNSGKWPTWRTVSSIICLFESSTCFEPLCAHLQEDNCINPYSANVENRVIS
jgi:hypothetical protein